MAVYPNAPLQVWGECTDTEMTLHWNYKNTEVELFCQTEVVQPDGKVELVWNLSFLNKNIVRIFVMWLKNNSPAIQIHCKSCERVDVSVFWICLLPKLYTDYAVHVGRHCWLWFTLQALPVPWQKYMCDWSDYVAQCSAEWVLRFVEVSENTEGPSNSKVV